MIHPSHASHEAHESEAFGLHLLDGGMDHDFHSQPRAQLVFLVRGDVTCEAGSTLWIVPPQSALWIPSGVRHRVKARAPLEGYSVFVDPAAAPLLPKECCSATVSPLLRELLMRAAEHPDLHDGSGARLFAVLLDELASARAEKLGLPMPTDPRLREIVFAMKANPAEGATIAEWAKRSGLGERTLNRILVQETGLSFGRWRQQLHIILALQWLSCGASVHSVAADLGYESSSSFVTMFRRAMGASPARFMKSRQPERS